FYHCSRPQAHAHTPPACCRRSARRNTTGSRDEGIKKVLANEKFLSAARQVRTLSPAVSFSNASVFPPKDREQETRENESGKSDNAAFPITVSSVWFMNPGCIFVPDHMRLYS